jgi:hypothetical protein
MHLRKYGYKNALVLPPRMMTRLHDLLTPAYYDGYTASDVADMIVRPPKEQP